MKKWAVCLCLILAIVGICVVYAGEGEIEGNSEYLRVHIRANSNSADDQAVKYLVRDSVVSVLTPTVAACNSKEEAMQAVEQNLSLAEKAAEEVLLQHGHGYGVRARLCREKFPTRVYDSVTLEGGTYDALILELGTGEGDNWWCVVYPPLCFTAGNGNVIYKSKIAETIRSFYQK